MPYKIEDLRAPGMDQNFHTIEGQIQQPARQTEPEAVPSPAPVPSKHPLIKPKEQTPKPIKKEISFDTSDLVGKAKTALAMVLLGLIAVIAVALTIRGIQWLFSI